MLDILGAMALTAIAIAIVALLARAAARDGTGRARIALAASGWFVAIAALAAAGLFASPGGLGTPAIGGAVAIPVVIGLIAAGRSRALRSLALGVPLALLVGLHAGRLLGVFFLELLADGRLPPTFALTAGWGDILVGAAAIPLAVAIVRRSPAWRPLALVWNTLGLLDLLAAVTLGIGSAPDSPLRFISESGASGTMATLPWLFIPGFLVPLYLLTHAAIFAQLAAGATSEEPGLAQGAISAR